jgi:succinate dehydrogenase / fumarate reductase flavoprotein subunit
VVSRAIATEVREGRGCGPHGDHVLLRLDHLGDEVIHKRLPAIRTMVQTFLHIDPAHDPIPVFPTAHYIMGGIPTNRFGQVVVPEREGPEEPLPGLYSVGECACVSVHGANRLGGNSLLDIVVFGRAAGNHIVEYLKEARYHRPLPERTLEQPLARLARWDRREGSESVATLRADLQRTMETYCGVFRNEDVLQQGINEVLRLQERMAHARLDDHSRVFNIARIQALELENLMEIALAVVSSALARRESRGAHSRIDYPERDDEHWMKHSLYSREGRQIDYKPVRMKTRTVEPFPPQPRVY